MDTVAAKLMETTIEDSSPSHQQNQKNSFLVLPAELLQKVFTEIDDHDTFQNMAFLSKHMHIIVKPYLMAKRKQILRELCIIRPYAPKSKVANLLLLQNLIQNEEEDLKQVLRTNQELTCTAHYLPIEPCTLSMYVERAQSERANANSLLPMAQASASAASSAAGNGSQSSQLGAEQRAYQLLQLALRHCYEFSEFYNRIIVPAINDVLWRHQLMSEDGVEAFLGGFAYRIFKHFLRKYPELSVYTDVHWPDQMPEEARKQLMDNYEYESDEDEEEDDDPNSWCPQTNTMCSSSSTNSSLNKIPKDDIDTIAAKLTETHIEDSSPTSQNQKNYFLILPAELNEKIFSKIDDHDTLQNMSFASKHMHSIVKPYLMTKRKQILDEFCNFKPVVIGPTNLEMCKELIRSGEKFLKRVLRTNEGLSCSAHNMPIERMPAHAFGKPRNTFFILGMLGLTGGREDQFSAEQRAYQLFQIALRHCYQFSKIYHDTIVPTVNNDGRMDYHQLDKNNLETFFGGFAYRIFENFLRKNPVLSVFTDVHWPDQMSEEARQQMVAQYAEQNAKNCKNKDAKKRGMGRMYEMRTKGQVEAYTTNPAADHYAEQHPVTDYNEPPHDDWD